MPLFSDKDLEMLPLFKSERFYRADPVVFTQPGLTIKNIVVIDDIIVHLVLENGHIISLYHDQDCCEEVFIADGLDELLKLKGERLIDISTVTEDVSDEDKKCRKSESATWTFMNVYTDKDTAQLRWYGSSNGYYSEDATFADTTRDFRNFVGSRKERVIKAGAFGTEFARLKWHEDSQTFQITIGGCGEIMAYCVQTEVDKLEDMFSKLEVAAREIFGRPNTKA